MVMEIMKEFAVRIAPFLYSEAMEYYLKFLTTGQKSYMLFLIQHKCRAPTMKGYVMTSSMNAF